MTNPFYFPCRKWGIGIYKKFANCAEDNGLDGALKVAICQAGCWENLAGECIGGSKCRNAARRKWRQWRQKALGRSFEGQKAPGDWLVGWKFGRVREKLVVVLGLIAALRFRPRAREVSRITCRAQSPLQMQTLNQLIGVCWKGGEIIINKLRFNTSRACCSDCPDLWDVRHCHWREE